MIVESPTTSPATLSSSQKVAIYTRVSLTENRANLESQAERVLSFCIARGRLVSKIVKECGSGVNDQRPQFLALLADTSLTHIVVEHKDRLFPLRGGLYSDTAGHAWKRTGDCEPGRYQPGRSDAGLCGDHYFFYRPTLGAKTGWQEETGAHRCFRSGGRFGGA